MKVNQVYLGDCREVMSTFPENSVAACVTDPPYNYEFIGRRWDDDEVKRRISRVQESRTLVKNIPYGSGMAGGVRTHRWYQRHAENNRDYQNWCAEWGRELFRVCKPGAIVAAFSSTRTLAHIQVGLEQAGFYARDCLVYRRHSGIPKGLNAYQQLSKAGDPNASSWQGWHSCFRNEWEAIVVVQKPLINNYLTTIKSTGVGLFKAIDEDGNFRSNILEGFRRGEADAIDGHCTVKPLALIEHLISLIVPRSSEHVVIDPFAGTGTTLVAAKNMGLQFVGIEIEPSYIPIIESRLAESAQVEERQSDSTPRQSLLL